MRYSWKFTGCDISSPEINYSQAITDDGQFLSVVFDNFVLSGTSVEISLPLESRYLSSKTTCVDIRGGSIYERGTQKLKMTSIRRYDEWGKKIHGQTSFFIPLRLTAYRNRLVFSLEADSDYAGNQVTIDTIDFFRARR